MGREIDIEIFELIKDVMHLSSACIQRSLGAEGTSIAPMEARCLSFVARHPGCTQNDIVMASSRDKGQIARVVKLLIERGALTRLADEAGERRHRLATTPEGLRIHEQAERHREAVARQMIRTLSGEEQKQLRQLLKFVHLRCFLQLWRCISSRTSGTNPMAQL